MNNNLYFNRHHPQRVYAKHAETIKKSTSLRTSARSFTPCPRLCGHPLWTAQRCLLDVFGAVHKVRHAIFGQFLPPLPLSHFVTHPGTPPKYATHLGPPPLFT